MNIETINDAAALWGDAMVRAGVQGALAVVAIGVLCRLLPRLAPSVRATLWWLVCARTLLALFVAGPIPIAVLPADRPAATVAPHTIPDATTWTPVFLEADVSPAPIAPARLSVSGALLCLWGLVVVALLLAQGRAGRVVGRLAARARPWSDVATADQIARAVGLRRTPPVRVADGAAGGSLVTGLWRPVVLLCQADLERLDAAERRALLAHEMAHLRRRDLWAGLVPSLTRALFFFDPLVWLACREYDLAREAACDAEALRATGLEPADYGRLLLDVSLGLPGRRAALGVGSPDGALLRRRLQALGRRVPAHRALSLLALLISGAALSLHPVQARRAATVPTAALPAPQMLRGIVPSSKPRKEESPMSVSKPVLALAAVAAAAVHPVTATPAQVAPVAIEAPVAIAPVAPVAPVAPIAREGRYQYTLRRGDAITTRARDRGVADAQRELAKAQSGDCIVVDRDGKRYLITDPDTVRRFHEGQQVIAVEGQRLLGKQFEEVVGKEMERYAQQMEAMGKLLGELGQQMEAQGELLEAAIESGKPEVDQKVAKERMREIQEKMKKPQEEMRALAQKMKAAAKQAIKEQKGEQGLKIRALKLDAEKSATAILDAAFASNLAVEHNAPAP